MGKDDQLEIAHRIPPETLDQHHRVRAAIDKGIVPVSSRDEDRVTLADVQDHHAWARRLPGLTDDQEDN
jgi:hypothetical protein